MDGLIKVGMFGSSTGTKRSINVAPMFLKSVTVRSKDTIDALTFIYEDKNKVEHRTDRWGGSLGDDHTFYLAPNEYVKEVSGTFGEFPLQHLPCTVNSLTFVTSGNKTYSYGTPRATDTKFRVPVEKGSIVGFFARAENFVSAIGFYVRP